MFKGTNVKDDTLHSVLEMIDHIRERCGGQVEYIARITKHLRHIALLRYDGLYKGEANSGNEGSSMNAAQEQQAQKMVVKVEIAEREKTHSPYCYYGVPHKDILDDWNPFFGNRLPWTTDPRKRESPPSDRCDMKPFFELEPNPNPVERRKLSIAECFEVGFQPLMALDIRIMFSSRIFATFETDKSTPEEFIQPKPCLFMLLKLEDSTSEHVESLKLDQVVFLSSFEAGMVLSFLRQNYIGYRASAAFPGKTSYVMIGMSHQGLRIVGVGVSPTSNLFEFVSSKPLAHLSLDDIICKTNTSLLLTMALKCLTEATLDKAEIDLLTSKCLERSSMEPMWPYGLLEYRNSVRTLCQHEHLISNSSFSCEQGKWVDEAVKIKKKVAKMD